MEFSSFAARAFDIEQEDADLEITDLVNELFHLADADLPVVARFIQGRIFPGWSSQTLDVGPALCYEAIAAAAGSDVTPLDIEDRLAAVGEIGEVAAGYEFGTQRALDSFGEVDTAGLTVREVSDTFVELAEVGGEGSEEKKRRLLFTLFNQCSSAEARYLARLVMSEMRIGVGEGTVRDAIAGAFEVPIERVERALQVSNDYGLVAETAREEGVEGLNGIRLDIGRPVQSMLAQSGTVSDALEDWDEVAVQPKYDGARIQAHYDGQEVRIFSRNMEDVTDPLPEIATFVRTAVDGPIILDGEVVAVADDGTPLPFQEILRRFRRKHDVEQAKEEVGLEVHFFDCLHVDGRDTLDMKLVDRHSRLAATLDEGVAPLSLTGDAAEIEEIETEAIEAGHEGVMLKNPISTYTPGRRGKNWLKRKPDVETLDLVVTGAQWGEGRRATFLGTFELSVRADDGFLTIGNVATGITDEELVDLTNRLESHIRTQEGQTVELEPAVVFEVGYEEIQRSPTYDSGYALRFPRFVEVRDDLTPADADTLERIEGFSKQ